MVSCGVLDLNVVQLKSEFEACLATRFFCLFFEDVRQRARIDRFRLAECLNTQQLPISF